jgi:hypothetical protein
MLDLSSESILQMSLGELHSTLKVIEQLEGENYPKLKETIEDVKFGTITFDKKWLPIKWIINKQYREVWKSNQVKIVGYGIFSLTHFHKDIEKREAIGKTFLLQYAQKERATRPMTKKDE